MSDPVLVILVFLIASIVHGVAGFGAGLVAMSLLVLKWPVTEAIAVCSVCTWLLNGWMAYRLWAEIDWSELRPMVTATLLGVPIGVTLLHSLPERWIIGGLGCVLIVHSVRSLRQGEGQRTAVASGWGYVAGALGGLLGGAFNTSGPPVVMYGTARCWAKDRFRATLQIYFLVTGTLAIALYVATGVVNQTSLGWTLLGIPVMVAGAGIGQVTASRISPELFRKLVLIGLALMGMNFIRRTLM